MAVRIDGYLYDDNCFVIDYGTADATDLVAVPLDSVGGTVGRNQLATSDTTVVMEMRACWTFWRVTTFHVMNGHWCRGREYHARTWAGIEEVWKYFFATAGLYTRVVWSCEAWQWSELSGFEPMNYV